MITELKEIVVEEDHKDNKALCGEYKITERWMDDDFNHVKYIHRNSNLRVIDREIAKKRGSSFYVTLEEAE